MAKGTEGKKLKRTQGKNQSNYVYVKLYIGYFSVCVYSNFSWVEIAAHNKLLGHKMLNKKVTISSMFTFVGFQT